MHSVVQIVFKLSKSHKGGAGPLWGVITVCCEELQPDYSGSGRMGSSGRSEGWKVCA